MEIEPPKSPLLKIAEAAVYLGMSQSWLKQNPERIPYVRIGKKAKRWLIRDLDEFLSCNVRGRGAKR